MADNKDGRDVVTIDYTTPKPKRGRPKTKTDEEKKNARNEYMRNYNRMHKEKINNIAKRAYEKRRQLIELGKQVQGQHVVAN